MVNDSEVDGWLGVAFDGLQGHALGLGAVERFLCGLDGFFGD